MARTAEVTMTQDKFDAIVTARISRAVRQRERAHDLIDALQIALADAVSALDTALAQVERYRAQQ